MVAVLEDRGVAAATEEVKEVEDQGEGGDEVS